MMPWIARRGNPSYPQHILPLSYSSFSNICECALRYCYSKDDRFPPKVSPQARLGTAFHRTLELISRKHEINTEQIIDLFDDEVRHQRAEACCNYREIRVPWPQELRLAMENQLASRTTRKISDSASQNDFQIEKTVKSADGRLIGRIDEIRGHHEDICIVDYKTSRYDAECLTKYENQLLFYSELCRQQYGVLPRYGLIIFILDKYEHRFIINQIQIDNLICKVNRISRTDPMALDLNHATVGHHCSYCSYKPWCDDYWAFNGKGEGDIEGSICSMHTNNSNLCISNNSHIIIVNKDKEPLPKWPRGEQVRAIGLSGAGNVRYHTCYSEIFKIQ
jgi:hypothetical protein